MSRSLLLSLPLFLLLLPSCTGDTASRRAARGEFYVSDPDHLYFKNTRARNYRAEEVAEKLTLYYHDELSAAKSRLELVITDNWLTDDARLTVVLRPEGVQANQTVEDLRLEIEDGVDGWRPLLYESVADIKKLRDGLAGTRRLRIVSFGEETDVFPDPKGRAAALEVVTDYLRLIGE